VYSPPLARTRHPQPNPSPSPSRSPGVAVPELHLKARTVLAIALESGAAEPLTGEESEPCSCLPGQLVAVQLELTRLHAGTGTVNAHGSHTLHALPAWRALC
jgi:hypothetical protein